MDIEPFHGYRYAGATRTDVSPIVAPPYDQISPETQERLHAMSPHNIVRATYPRDGEDKYRQAASVLEAWLAQGVWRRDGRPAIYPYPQTYSVGGQSVTRTGFIALGEVSDYARGVVLPHERTHAGPKEDRMRLLEATAADIGLLFMLVSDADGELGHAAAPVGELIAEAEDLRGERHRLWRITDDAALARIVTLMAPRPVIIADGHHRYETAVAYRQRHPHAARKMMAFFAVEARAHDPGESSAGPRRPALRLRRLRADGVALVRGGSARRSVDVPAGAGVDRRGERSGRRRAHAPAGEP